MFYVFSISSGTSILKTTAFKQYFQGVQGQIGTIIRII